jgi:NTE family protein
MNMLQDSAVIALRDTIRDKVAGGKYTVSDLLLTHNGETYQFVDLVMEGGGTLGIALVGYIYALECANIRFLSVGGSSVGAIVALLLACHGGRMEEKGADLAEVISNMDMGSFIDGGLFSGALSQALGSGKIGDQKLRILLLALLSSRTLLKKLGLNPGDKFLLWLTTQLQERGISSLREAMQVIEYIPEGLVHRVQGTDFEPPTPALKIVAADITTSSKIVFPEMASLYWEEADVVNPALFARASMSIPLFFQPMTVTGVSKIVQSTEKWANLCSFKGTIPDKITFADGGLLSNFPISLFHKPRVPNAPTFGARLGSYSRVVNEIHSLGGYFNELFNSLRHDSDFDFIYQNSDYRRLITYIPTAGHNWLNFYMSDAEKLVLFKKGMNAAHDFLEQFDWQAYKEIRRKQIAPDAPITSTEKGVNS